MLVSTAVPAAPMTFGWRPRAATPSMSAHSETPGNPSPPSGTDWVADDATYRTIVEHIPTISYIAEWTPDANLRYVSPQIEAVLGFPPKAFIEDPDFWYARVHPDDLENVRAEEHRSHEQESTFDLEFRMIAADGRELWFREIDTVIRDEDGKPLFSQGVLVDVTERHQADRLLREERDRAQRYLDVAGTMIVVIDPDGALRLINAKGCEVLGRSEDELLGTNWFEAIVPESHREATREALARLLEGDQSAVSHENPVITRNGEERTIAWHNTLLRDDSGAVISILQLGRGRHRAPPQRGADRPPRLPRSRSPGCPTARCSRSTSSSRSPAPGATTARSALLYLDLDDFRLVNDSLGHGAGDELLRGVGERLASVTRQTDLLARQGGDEFLLMLTDLDGDPQKAAEAVANQITAALSDSFDLGGAEFQVGASIGISLFPRDAGDGDALLAPRRRGDVRGEALGEPRLQRLRDEPHRAARAPVHRDAPAQGAGAQGAARCTTSRSGRCAEGRLVAVEALIRWEDPYRGLVCRSTSSPIAEETELIEPIGDWVIEDGVPPGRRVAQPRPRSAASRLNVSPRQLRRPGSPVSCASTWPGQAPGRRADGRDHRVAAMREPEPSSPSSPRCTGWACGSRSTTSAPATRRSRACASCRWTS